MNTKLKYDVLIKSAVNGYIIYVGCAGPFVFEWTADTLAKQLALLLLNPTEEVKAWCQEFDIEVPYEFQDQVPCDLSVPVERIRPTQGNIRLEGAHE